MLDVINIRLSDPIGCTIISTGVLLSVRSAFPAAKINIYTKHPDLVSGTQGINSILDAALNGVDYHIDLTNYVETLRPFELLPHRHLLIHQFEIANQQINSRMHSSVQLHQLFPELRFNTEERSRALRTYDQLAKGKPLVWLQMKTSTKAKDWNEAGWREVRQLSSSCNFVNLQQYSVKDAIALAAICDAGVTLDTYALHGAAAVGAQNVIGLMISSPWEVVGYAGQKSVNGLSDDAAQQIANILAEAVHEPDGRLARANRRRAFVDSYTWA
jgi:hypothetical protein